MGLHSGKWGRVNGVDTMRQWSISEVARHPKAVASNTLLGTARRRGVRSWSGSYNAYGEQPVAGAMPGQIFSFEGYGAPNNDVSGGDGLLYQGDACIKSVAITWDWKGGNILSHVVNFDGHLELVKEDGPDPGDAVVPNLKEIAACKIDYAMFDLGVFTTLPNITTATLTISSTNSAYVNSSTVIGGVIWTGCTGGPIDWTCAIAQEDVNRLPADIFDIGDSLDLKLFTTASEFWRLTHGMVRDFTGIRVNRETGEIIARTINVDMNCYYGSTPGTITKPGGSQWWPF